METFERKLHRAPFTKYFTDLEQDPKWNMLLEAIPIHHYEQLILYYR